METTDLRGSDDQWRSGAEKMTCGPSHLASTTLQPPGSLEGDHNGQLLQQLHLDYRKVNHITNLDEFPLPRIDETLHLLAGAKYFTTLDLASGYWQVLMEPTAQEKTAFVTHCGLYEFTKMPFELVNAPATFQQLMELVLSELAKDK